jgi:histidinol dehydrogenase
MSPSEPLPILDYARLDAAGRRAALERPAADDRAQIIAAVRETVRDVQARGDAAVLE